MKFGLREVIFILVLLAMPALAYLSVFKPQNQQQQDARNENIAKRARLQLADQASDDFVDLAAEIDRLRTTIELIEEKLPAGREEYQVVRTVADLALQHNLTVRSVNPDKVVPAANYSELPVRLEIEGDFDGFYAFMLEVERMPRITQMPLMALKKTDRSEAEGVMVATVTLSIFFEQD